MIESNSRLTLDNLAGATATVLSASGDPSAPSRQDFIFAAIAAGVWKVAEEVRDLNDNLTLLLRAFQS